MALGSLEMRREPESNKAGRRGATPSHPVLPSPKSCSSMRSHLILQNLWFWGGPCNPGVLRRLHVASRFHQGSFMCPVVLNL